MESIQNLRIKIALLEPDVEELGLTPLPNGAGLLQEQESEFFARTPNKIYREYYTKRRHLATCKNFLNFLELNPSPT